MVTFLLPHSPSSSATAAPADARSMTDDAAFARMQRHPGVLCSAEVYFWSGSMSEGKLNLLNQYPLQQLLALCRRNGGARPYSQATDPGQLLLGQ
jgi:hypothetical protein